MFDNNSNQSRIQLINLNFQSDPPAKFLYTILMRGTCRGFIIFLRLLGTPHFFSFGLLWLLVLVALGTLAQSSLGILEAQRVFFSSYVYFLGDLLPTPGGRSTLILISSSLFSNLVFMTQWSLKKTGIITTHLGALTLLMGGLITGSLSEEGSLAIPPLGTRGYFSDYHSLEFAIAEEKNPLGQPEVVFSLDPIDLLGKFKSQSLSFEIEVLQVFKDSKIEMRSTKDPLSENKGFYSIFEVSESSPDTKTKSPQAGMVFRIRGADPGQDGVYAVFEEMAVTQRVLARKKKFDLMIRKARKALPFQLKLLAFDKSYYPGTRIAKFYQSKVQIIENDLIQPAIIEMNSPLRHRGYTIFQSSFSEGQNGDTSILVVVKNVGAWIPYLSCLLIGFGLLLHLFLRTPENTEPAVVEESKLKC